MQLLKNLSGRNFKVISIITNKVILFVIISQFLMFLFQNVPILSGVQSKKSKISVKLLRKEAKNGFIYLNKIRSNPKLYSNEFGVDLNNIEPRPPLLWNNILAKVAEEKASDMAKRNYLSHITPEGLGINIMIYRAGYSINPEMIKDSTTNSFESITAGYDKGEDAVKSLVIDLNTPSLGHRFHLLGFGSWYAGLDEVGIGIARNPFSLYEYYTCVIIAAKSKN
jgi:uncharacterized protein YkwD